MEGQHTGEGSMGFGDNQSRGSSRALRAMEQERRGECRGRDRHKTQDDP